LNQELSDHYNLNTTVTGVKGIITSLNYPANYYHNLDYWIHVVGPHQSRIVFQFDSINIEPQADCLYDFVAVVEPKERENRTMTVCGYRGNHLEEWDYIVITFKTVNITIYLFNKKKKIHNFCTMPNRNYVTVTSLLPIWMKRSCTSIRTTPCLVLVFISSGTQSTCPVVRRKHCPLSKAKLSVQTILTLYFQISTASPWYWHRVRARTSVIKPRF